MKYGLMGLAHGNLLGFMILFITDSQIIPTTAALTLISISLIFGFCLYYFVRYNVTFERGLAAVISIGHIGAMSYLALDPQSLPMLDRVNSSFNSIDLMLILSTGWIMFQTIYILLKQKKALDV